jgi:lysine-specific demethylase 3
MTLAESSRLHPTVPHSWLCNGKLLILEDPTNVDNINLFQVPLDKKF